MKFISAYALLVVTTSFLCSVAFQLATTYPAVYPMLYIQILGVFWCVVLLGLGLGIVTLVIAATMSWLQVALLMMGNIDPHMAESGFVKTLTTFWKVVLGQT